MEAVIKREMKGYFSSATGYVFLAVFFIFSGFFFSLFNLMFNTSNMSSLFNSLTQIYVILIPILTMRLLCEEKKQKTDQLLLTSPVSLSGIVLGKFFAALVIFAIGLASSILYAVTMALYVNVDTFVILGNIIGELLLGSALISIGLFISNLTENQVISGVASIFVMLILFFTTNLSSTMSNPVLKWFFSAIAIFSHYNNFSLGILNLGDVVYYFSTAVIFLFLTIRVLEKRRWS